MEMKKRHLFVRSIGWCGVVVMTLAAPALFVESLSCREVPPWELCSFMVLEVGAALCLAQGLLFFVMALKALAKVKASRWWKWTKDPSAEALEMLALKDALAKDGKKFANVVMTIACVAGTAIVVLLAAAWRQYETDLAMAQTTWRCGGVPLVYTVGIYSVVFAFFVWMNPLFGGLLGLFIRWLGLTEASLRAERTSLS